MTTTTTFSTWTSLLGTTETWGEANHACEEAGVDLKALVDSVLPEGFVLLGNGEILRSIDVTDDHDVECDLCGRTGEVHTLVHQALAGC